MSCPAGTPNGVEALPEQAVEAAREAVFGGMPQGRQYVNERDMILKAVRAFLAKATGPDLLSLAAERIGDQEKEALVQIIAKALREAQGEPSWPLYQFKPHAMEVLTALLGENR